jgi:hypothetical protein
MPHYSETKTYLFGFVNGPLAYTILEMKKSHKNIFILYKTAQLSKEKSGLVFDFMPLN